MAKRVLAGVDLEPVSLSSRNSEELPISSSGSSDATFTSASEITISSKENGGPKTGDLKFVTDGNGKGAAGKGDSDGVGNGAGQGKVKEVPSIYLSVDSNGVWFDTNQDGLLDLGEVVANLTQVGSTGFYAVDGVDMAANPVTVRFLETSTPQKLDLSGFGVGDKIVFDVATKYSSYLGASAFLKSNIPASLYNSPTNPFKATFGNWKYAGASYYLQASTFVFISAQLNVNRAGNTKVTGFANVSGSYAPTQFNFRNTLAKGLAGGSGYAVEAIMPI